MFPIYSSNRPFLSFIPAIALCKPPAAGYRHNASGALTNVGTEGDLWSSSSYAAGNVNAGFLNFRSGNVNPLNNTNRAHALSVRCVQYLRGLFFAFGDPIKNNFLYPEWRGPRLPPAR